MGIGGTGGCGGEMVLCGGFTRPDKSSTSYENAYKLLTLSQGQTSSLGLASSRGPKAVCKTVGCLLVPLYVLLRETVF